MPKRRETQKDPTKICELDTLNGNVIQHLKTFTTL